MRRNNERGFSLLEGTIGLMILGVVIAFAAPRISNAMGQYRVDIAMRQTVDIIKRAKTQAVSENRRSGIVADTATNRLGLVFYNDDLSVNRIEFIPLPQGVSFQRPADIATPPAGVNTTGVVSFPKQGNYYQQDFNSRGFPLVASGADVVSIFVGNGREYRAVTMTSVGGISTFMAQNKQWVNTRK
jgi:type II secretory pathway pseudopilin PulG